MNNSFKKMEYLLYNFKTLDTKIANIELDIQRLINDVTLGGGDMFGEKSSPTNKISSSVESEVLKREENDIDGKLKRLRNKKQNFIFDKQKIHNAISCLSSIEYSLVEIRYFSNDRITWEEVSERLGYSAKHCKTVRDKIILRLIDILEI